MATLIVCGQVCSAEGWYQFTNRLGDVDEVGRCPATSYLKQQRRTIPLLIGHVHDWVLGRVIPGTMVRSKKDGLLLAAEVDSAKADLLDSDRWYLSPDLTFVRYQLMRDEGAAVNEVSVTTRPAGCALRYPVRYARSDAAITPKGWPYATTTCST